MDIILNAGTSPRLICLRFPVEEPNGHGPGGDRATRAPTPRRRQGGRPGTQALKPPPAPQISTTVMDVEFPLIESQLSAIDVKLQAAETTLFWNGEGAEAGSASPREGLGRGRGARPGPAGVCPVSHPAAAPAFRLGVPLCLLRGRGHGWFHPLAPSPDDPFVARTLWEVAGIAKAPCGPCWGRQLVAVPCVDGHGGGRASARGGQLRAGVRE